MTHYRDTLPFDYSRAQAQQLRESLASILYRGQDVEHVLSDAGMPL